MEELTQLFINTRWRQAHKWDVGDDGLVEYHDERIQPSELVSRFIIEFPMFDVIRAETCRRENVTDGPKAYRWVTLERFA